MVLLDPGRLLHRVILVGDEVFVATLVNDVLNLVLLVWLDDELHLECVLLVAESALGAGDQF